MNVARDIRLNHKVIRTVISNKVELGISAGAFELWYVMADEYPFYTRGKSHYAPSNERLAKITCNSEKTIRNHLLKLQKAGLIKALSKKKGCATWWQVNYQLHEIEALLPNVIEKVDAGRHIDDGIKEFIEGDEPPF